MYLIDTSIWLDFLKGKNTPHVRLLEGLLEEGEAFLCELTSMEVCLAAKRTKQFRKYLHAFATLPFLSLPIAWHEKAAFLGHQLGKQGTPTLRELILLTTARTHGAILVSSNRRFRDFQIISGVSLL